MEVNEDNYLNELNEQQREAVEYLDGPQLVIAGAGSGKTRVITYKIVHLLHKSIPPWSILALTFTNKAAREMRDRIQSLVGEDIASQLWMGTFHSIFSKILHAQAPLLGFKNAFTIYDTADSKNLVKSIVKELELDEKVYKPATVLGEISRAKNWLISPTTYAESKEMMAADAKDGRPKLALIYRMYCERCKAAEAMDFDDLLYYTNILFDKFPEVLEFYRKKFRYILVDEYQDTNACQHRIVEKLVKNSRALCVVGDDAQSIYSFRGANIGNILNLREDFPELKVFKLERNYRSTQNIVNAAGSLISRNSRQIPKTVFSQNESGDRIEVVKCYTDMEESYKVAARISQRRTTSGDPYSEFAILYRTNAQSRVLEESLRKRSIPYRIYGGLSFYQRKEVKDALSYFRLAVNPDDDEALKRVINYPARGIGETTVQRLTRVAFQHGRSLWYVLTTPELIPSEVKGAARKKLQAFASLIEEFLNMDDEKVTADILAFHILKRSGILNMFDYDTTPENISKRENVNELLSSVREYVETAREQGEENPDMSGYLTTVSLSTDQDSDDSDSNDRVTLMTAHSAKGLEFNNVFIVGVEDGLFPSSMSQGSLADIEEERRLLYVAMTRARKFCMMSYAMQRFRNGTYMSTNISPFLREIDSRCLRSSGSDLHVHEAQPKRTVNRSPVSDNMLHTARSLSEIRRDMSSRPHPAASGGMDTHDVSELEQGMSIRHPKFGNGIINEILLEGSVGPRIDVTFEDGSQRVLLLKFAKFDIL
ncbi:MAG: UvrD-helicase domain-containing protein [Muribaculaceae bacterium]|nr:UvrD-helicase domain-containing protein [Muribaculaceae bacterium]